MTQLGRGLAADGGVPLKKYCEEYHRPKDPIQVKGARLKGIGGNLVKKTARPSTLAVEYAWGREGTRVLGEKR